MEIADVSGRQLVRANRRSVMSSFVLRNLAGVSWKVLIVRE